MYFAMDKGNPSALLDRLNKIVEQHDDYDWYIFLDGAFDIGKRKPYSLEKAIKLYFSQEWEPLKCASPILLPYDRDNHAFNDSLLSHCNGRPMLSVLATKEPSESIVDYWQRYLSVETENGATYILRFADTRVLSNLLSFAPDSYFHQLSAPIELWLVIDRSGQWQAVSVSPKGKGMEKASKISEEELEALIEKSMPDILANMLHEHFPELVKESGCILFKWMVALSKILKVNSIENSSDQLAMAVAISSTKGELLNDKRLNEVLKIYGVGAQWVDQLTDLVDKTSCKI